MKKSCISKIACCIVAICSLSSCAVSNKLAQDESYLVKNKITIHDVDKELNYNSISPYIKQQTASFNLFGTEHIVFNPNLVSSSEENIKNHLAYLGYYNSQVSTEVTTKKHKTKVHYIVNPGKRYIIDKIDYIIPSGEFAQDYMSDSSNFSVLKGSFLSEEALEQESERAAAFMRTKGYYDFTGSFFRYEADTLASDGTADLVMTINENTNKYSINDVSITYPSNLKFKTSVLKGMNTIKPGQIYNETDVINTYNRLSGLKIFSSVGIELTKTDSSKVNCNINLAQSRMQGFKFDLEASTNSSGLMGISPQLTFFHKNIFNGGEWLNLSFLGNFQFKPQDNVRSNEFGASASISFPKFLGLPYSFFKGRNIPRTELNFSYNYQDRPEYMRNILSTSIGYTGTISKMNYQFYPLQLNFVKLNDLDDSFSHILDKNPYMKYSYQDHFNAGGSATVYLSSDMSLNPKSTYQYLRFSGDIAGNLISLFNPWLNSNKAGDKMILGAPYTQFVRAELTLGKTWTFGAEEGQSIATRLLGGVGIAYGNSTSLPYETQFYSGGANSMRGWQTRSLGPGYSMLNKYFTIPSQTGDIKLEANLEYRFDIFWKLAGALFVDVGNIWLFQETVENIGAAFTKDFYRSLAANWGTGLRLDLDFLVIRVDMGFKMRDPSRYYTGENLYLKPKEWFSKNGCALHFGVGYPF